MAQETLLTAARRVYRQFNIDQNCGLISTDLCASFETLAFQIDIANKAATAERERVAAELIAKADALEASAHPNDKRLAALNAPRHAYTLDLTEPQYRR